MRKKLLVAVILACVGLSACNNGYAEVPSDPSVITDDVKSVTVSPSELNLNVADTSTIYANVDVTGTAPSLEWFTSDAAVITLFNQTNNSVGVLANRAGTAFVTASCGGKSSACKVVVGSGGGGQGEIVVTSITLSDNTKNIFAGDEFNLTATVVANGSPTVNFVTSDSSVLQVTKQSNSLALVKGLKEGSAIVTASAGSKSATCTVNVLDNEATLAIVLNKSSLTLKEGNSETLVATTKPEDAVVTWQSNDTDVATVNNGVVTALAAGNATITASVTDGVEVKTAQCTVKVTGEGGDDYESQIAQWSKPGHLYLHYLRKNADYDKWALWIWQTYPHNLPGSLWGAAPQGTFDLKGVTPQTYGYMTNKQTLADGDENAYYSDEYGQIIDVDLTVENLVDGKTGKPAPLVSWNDAQFSEFWPDNELGFLIVDQSKMTGKDMWVSDGGAETYISGLGSLMPNGKTDYLHIYCVEGSVADYQTSSGTQTETNPTADDTTGKYRSKNDITNLKYDQWTNGVNTSTSFLEDRPGVGYQIFVPSFADSNGDGIGDLRGIIDKLDYLEDLGVEVLWLTPIQQSNSYHGYDVTDYYKIDKKFGTMEDYQELIYKAHSRGMKVLMDMVINHTSKSNVLYKKSQKAVTEEINGKTINYRDMYLWKYKGDQILQWDQVPVAPNASANFETVNVETSSDWYRDGTSNYYYYGKFGSGMAELNYSSQATRDYMTDMCKYWLSFGLDGFRLDAIKHIYLLAELDYNYNYSGDDIVYDVGMRKYYNEEMMQEVEVPNDYTYDRDLNVIFWKQFAGTLKSAYPNCFLVGENFDGWDARIAPFYEALDSQFDFATYYHLNEKWPDSMGSSIYNSLNGNESNTGAAWTRKGYYSYRKDAINGAYTSNHDIARMMNHAAGHRASVQAKYNGGDAIHHTEINADNYQYAINMSKYYAAVTILSPGVSWIYYGDELGMTGNLKDLVEDSTGAVYDDHGNNIDRWYRQPMKWGNTIGQDNVPALQFGGIEVLWDKMNQNMKTVPQQLADSNSLLNHFKLLTAIKNDDRYPTYGNVVERGSLNGDSSGCYLMISDGTHKVRIRINNGDTDVTLGMPDSGTFLGGSSGATNAKIPAHGFHVILA